MERFIFGIKVSFGTPLKSGYLAVLNDKPIIYIYGNDCNTCYLNAFYDPTKSSSFAWSSTIIQKTLLYDFTVDSK